MASTINRARRHPWLRYLLGLLLVVIVLLVAPYADWLPNAAMAGILFMVAWGLIDFKEIRHILKGSRRETAVMVVTFLGALFLELELAIFAGILLSLVLYLERGLPPPYRQPGPQSHALQECLL